MIQTSAGETIPFPNMSPLLLPLDSSSATLGVVLVLPVLLMTCCEIWSVRKAFRSGRVNADTLGSSFGNFYWIICTTMLCLCTLVTWRGEEDVTVRIFVPAVIIAVLCAVAQLLCWFWLERVRRRCRFDLSREEELKIFRDEIYAKIIFSETSEERERGASTYGISRDDLDAYFQKTVPEEIENAKLVTASMVLSAAAALVKWNSLYPVSRFLILVLAVAGVSFGVRELVKNLRLRKAYRAIEKSRPDAGIDNVSPEAVIAFAEKEGWKVIPRKDESIRVLQKHIGEKLCQVTIPVDRSLGDYKEAMQAAVREIAAVKMIDPQKLMELLAAEKKGE